MLINLVAFILLVMLLCGCIWFWVRKNVQPISDRYSRHYPSESMAAPVKKDQPEEKPQAKQPVPAVSANVPTAAPTVQERWCDWLTLSTTIITVMALMMTFLADRASISAVLASGQENNQWTLYQSKSVKEHTFQISKTALELQLKATPGISAEAAERYRQVIKQYDDELKRYKDEKEEILQEALALGKTKGRSQKLAAGFTSSLSFLLIAVLLSSIAIMMRKKYIWYAGLSMLAGWLYFFINSF